MDDSNSCSQEQLEMQARASKRRIEQINKILESGVQAKKNPEIGEDEKWFIDRLSIPEISNADLCSTIDTLEMLLSLDALLPLINFMTDEKHSKALRKQAAKAISVIGNNYVETELNGLLSSPSPELRLLAEIALGIKSPNAA